MITSLLHMLTIIQVVFGCMKMIPSDFDGIQSGLTTTNSGVSISSTSGTTVGSTSGISTSPTSTSTSSTTTMSLTGDCPSLSEFYSKATCEELAAEAYVDEIPPCFTQDAAVRIKPNVTPITIEFTAADTEAFAGGSEGSELEIFGFISDMNTYEIFCQNQAWTYTDGTQTIVLDYIFVFTPVENDYYG